VPRIMTRNRKLWTTALLAVASLALLPTDQARDAATQVSEVAHYYLQLEEAHPDLGRWQRLLLSVTMSAGQEPQPEESGGSAPESGSAG